MAVKVQVEALDLISQLGQEMVVAYAAEDETVATIVAALLDFQLRTPEITVGTISGSYSTLTRSIKVDGDTILRALYKLHSTVGGYIHVDNDRQLQWEDSIGEDKGQQLRYNKNLKGIERDINYRGLINRLYAYGAGEGTARIKLSDAEGQDEDYVQDQTSHDTWGGWYPGSLVDISITHPDTLLAWANLRLAEIKDPIISYSVNVVDLSESNVAEFSFDALQLGSIVKVIDEDLGIDVSVSVVKITHHDLANPQNMTVELSSRVKDITDTLMEVYGIQQFQQHIATVIGAGQVIVKGAFTVLDWVTGGETTIKGSVIETGTIVLGALNFIPLTSEGGTEEIIATINATVEGGLRISAAKISLTAGRQIFKQDSIPTSLSVGDLWFDTNDDNKLYRADSIGADAITAGEWELVRDDQIATNAASITVNETQISLNVTDISNLEGDMTTAEAAIVVNANAITLEVTNRTNADSTLQGQITVNAGNIVLKVSKNDVINQINISIEGIKIQADNISISGATTFSAGYDPTDKVPEGGAAADVNAGVTTISGGKITTNTIVANKLQTSTMTSRTITLSGASSILKGNYSAGNTGWQIKGDGNAEFNQVTVRGTIYATAGEFTGTLKASNIESGKTLTVNGAISAASGAVLIDDNGLTVIGQLIRLKHDSTTHGFLLASGAAIELRSEPGYDAMLTAVQAEVLIGASISGTVRVYSNLNPYDNNDVYLGVSAKRWKGGYFVDLNVSGTFTIGALSATTVTASSTISGVAGTFSGLLKGQGVQPYSANQDVGITGNRFRHGWFTGTITVATVSATTIGATTGNITTVNATTVNASSSVVTGLIYKAGNITISAGDGANNILVRGACLEPYGSGNTGMDIGIWNVYYDKAYVDTYYGKTDTIQGFQGHDDIALLRSIKSKANGRLDPATFPAEISPPVGKGKGKFVDMLNWESLNMGALLQLADKFDELEARVAAHN